MCCKHRLHFYRQLILLAAKCLVSFSSGINLAFPSVLNPAILAPDSDIKATPDQASWIATCLGIGGLVGFIIIPSIFEIFGRKVTNIVTSVVILVGGLMFYVTNDIYSLACARLIQGLSIGGSFVSAITISECISPHRRGYFMVLYKISIGFGSLACHSLGSTLNWRQIATVGALPNFISIILFMICAESPSFFAKLGRFEECTTSFKWYRGDSLNARNELNQLTMAQMKSSRSKERRRKNILINVKNMLLTKEFRKSFMIVTLTTLCLDSCGRYFLLTYITQILRELTKDLALAMYISIAFDCILILALCISSILIIYFKRRTLFFKLGSCSVFLMFMVTFSIVISSRFTFLQNLKWLTLAIILLHAFIINVGLVPIAFTLISEVYTLDHRGLGSCMSGIVSLIFFNFVLKLTPHMIENIGVEGTYAIYGICLCICLLLLRSILPETKDKTLQQIEDEIKEIVRRTSETELGQLYNLKSIT